MTKQDIFNLYDVNKYGIIESHEKFEGCMYYLPYYWSLFLDGQYNMDDRQDVYIDITQEEKNYVS